MNYKLTYLCAAVASATCMSAAAASEVQVYGIVDTYVQYYNVGGKQYGTIGSGGMNGSRIGFKGTEDLGSGNSVFFRLENGFFTDTGGNTTAAQPDGWAFQREAVLGVKGNWGTLSFGRQYTLNFGQMAMFDAFGLSLGSTLNNFMAPAPVTSANYTPGFNGANGNDNLTRADNSILYETPSFGGFKVAAMVGLGNSKTDEDSTTLGNIYAVQATYRSGALATGITWTLQNLNGGTYVPALKNRTKNNIISAGGSYDFNVTKLYLNVAYKTSGDEKNSDPDLWIFGGSLKTPMFGGHLLNGFHYLVNNTRDNANAWNISARFDYPLSKRTSVYAGAAYLNNERNANYTINGGGGASSAPGGTAALGKDPWTFFSGICHKF